MGGAREYLEAFFEADYERCDDVLRDELGGDVRGVLDGFFEVAGAAIRLTASRIGREPSDVLATLFAQARRERPVSSLVEEEVTARTLMTDSAAPPDLDGHDPAEVLAEVAGLVAIVTQGLAVITGDTLAAVLDSVGV